MTGARSCLVAFLAVALLPSCHGAATPHPSPPPSGSPSDAAGYRPLFNGRDLTGWHTNAVEVWGCGTGGSWRVEDGAISGGQDPPGNGGHLLTDEVFDRFEVVFDTKVEWGNDSGFYLRASDDGRGLQIMIDQYEGGNVGEIEVLDAREELALFMTFELGPVFAPGTRTVTSSTARPAAATGPAPVFDLATWPAIWKVGDWNRVRARLAGTPLVATVHVNDHPVSRAAIEERFERVLGAKGSFALQVHGGQEMWRPGARALFRRILVKDLP